MVLTVSFVISPVIGFLATVAPRITPRDLTPAPRRQDHTTSPSALVPFVKGTAASTASRPNVRDDGQRPSLATGQGGYRLICTSEKQKYFSKSGWPSGQTR